MTRTITRAIYQPLTLRRAEPTKLGTDGLTDRQRQLCREIGITAAQFLAAKRGDYLPGKRRNF